ncbi:MAG: serine hydrolase domain-containing protein [Gammaproteobacteria bacterium]|nr:serine hydrolase domain-containing protein [Gammaproteobacteria bacterium]
MDVLVSGTCDPAFEAVKDAFIGNFTERGDIGASVAVVIDGKPVVDLWGGWRDAGSKLPWERDTLVNVWSLGKAMSAVALLKLMEEHDVSPDDTVAAHWPEFSAGDKGEITFRQIMSHQAGLCAIEEKQPADAFLDWGLMTASLARQRPWWTPGICPRLPHQHGRLSHGRACSAHRGQASA